MKWKLNWLLNKLHQVDKEKNYELWCRLYAQYTETLIQIRRVK